MKKMYRLMVVLAGLATSWTAQAFGPDGHQQVAAIAAALLKGSVAEHEVTALLGGVPLTAAAVWADCAKGVRKDKGGKFAYQSDSVTFPECAPFDKPGDKSRFEDFVLANLTQCGHAKGTEFCHNQYHYTDISPFRSRYDAGYVGAQKWDVVQAINAAMVALRDGPEATPAPFVFADRKQALMLLAHYVGDIHQPLHVAALYLTPNGMSVDPDVAGYQPDTDTNGGNYLLDVVHTVPARPPKTKKDYIPSLHSDWDGLPTRWKSGSGDELRMIQRAVEVTVTPGDWRSWSAQWASEAIVQASQVFGGLSFSATGVPPGGSGAHRWSISGVDDVYLGRMAQFKETQLARGGARLAQLLKTVWPDHVMAPPLATAGAFEGYLTGQTLPDIRLWLAAAPAKGSAGEAADVDAFKLSRILLTGERGMMAANDDVFDPVLIVARFADALGGPFTATQAPTLMRLIRQVQADADKLVAPVKLKVEYGGRRRPFIFFPAEPSCLYPRDMAGHREADYQHQLDKSGSYPSTHALVGMMVGMVLSQARPERGDALVARGMAFGESRVVCGFHYPSDVAAGRLAAAVLFAKLQTQPAFQGDLARVKLELAAAH